MSIKFNLLVYSLRICCGTNLLKDFSSARVQYCSFTAFKLSAPNTTSSFVVVAIRAKKRINKSHQHHRVTDKGRSEACYGADRSVIQSLQDSKKVTNKIRLKPLRHYAVRAASTSLINT